MFQEPVASNEGLGGTYFFSSEAGACVGIMKPVDEEPLAPNNPKVCWPGWQPDLCVKCTCLPCLQRALVVLCRVDGQASQGICISSQICRTLPVNCKCIRTAAVLYAKKREALGSMTRIHFCVSCAVLNAR